MKKVLVLILSIICCNTLYSQHWIGVSADADLAWQLDKIPTTSAKIGGGTGIGFVYQYQYNHFILETGVRGEFLHNPIGITDSLLHFDMLDTRGTQFVYNGYLKNRVDASNNLSLSVPLMLGVEYNYFYGLVGAKVNYFLLSSTHQTAQLATTGDYDRYYETLVDMPNHGFHDYIKAETKGSMKYNLDARITAEIGTSIYSSNRSTKFRIGIFAEYGVRNIRKQTTEEPMLAPDLSEYMHVNMTHIYSTPYNPTSSVNNLICGIRFSALFLVGNARSNHASYRSNQSRHSRHSYPCRCMLY